MATDRVIVTASETIHVERPPEEVFDFTQDYATRAEWDRTVESAEVLSREPLRVRAVLTGLGPVVLDYSLFRRPERTSAAFTELRSSLFAGGGGSWSYAPRDGGTDWTQTNTLELRHRLLGRLLAPMLRRNMQVMTRKSMAAAKQMMEVGRRSSST